MSVSDPPSRSRTPSPRLLSRTATLVTTRSIIFSSSLYNSNATLSDDAPLPATLPVLTPPLTPVQWTHRILPQPSELSLASAEEKDGQRRDEQSGDEWATSTVRNRRTTRSMSASRGQARQAAQTSEEKQSVSPATAAALVSSPPRVSNTLPASLPTTQPDGIPSSSASHKAHTERIHPSLLVPSYPFHRKSQPSALSTEAPPVSLRGLYNLAGITLFTLTARMVLENVRVYGWLLRMNVVYALSEDWDRTYPCLLIAFFVCCVSPVVSWAIERYGGEGAAWERRMGWAHALHIAAVFVVPQLIITATNASIVSGLVLVLTGMVTTMKLVSFAHVCHDIRHRMRMRREGKQAETTSVGRVQDVSALHPVLPDHYSVELSHVLYFMLAPTLIYQLSYPKSNPTGHIRIAFLVRRLVELVFCLILQLLIIEQYLYPTVRNAMQSISGMQYLTILESVLKVALPNGQTPPRLVQCNRVSVAASLTSALLSLCLECSGVVWLLMFYSLFHSWLNILAELMNFGTAQTKLAQQLPSLSPACHSLANITVRSADCLARRRPPLLCGVVELPLAGPVLEQLEPARAQLRHATPLRAAPALRHAHMGRAAHLVPRLRRRARAARRRAAAHREAVRVLRHAGAGAAHLFHAVDRAAVQAAGVEQLRVLADVLGVWAAAADTAVRARGAEEQRHRADG